MRWARPEFSRRPRCGVLGAPRAGCVAAAVPSLRRPAGSDPRRHGGSMHEVNVGHKTLADYRSIVPGELIAEIDELAAALRGKRVLHVNATAFGGGVAEILYTLVPLTSDAGLPAEWQVITAPPEFYNVRRASTTACRAMPWTSRPLRGSSTIASVAPTPPSSRAPTTSS